MSDEATFDAVADELYGLRPDEFAAARDEQVKRARAAGQAALARELSKLRRPTQSAWLINLLWRDQREVLEQLFELASELSAAYAEASREELQRVTAQQRQLEVALMRRARELGQQAGVSVSADTEREAQETLTAALAQPAAADELRSGRLTRPIPYAGFGAPTGQPGAASGRGAERSAAETASGPARSVPAAGAAPAGTVGSGEPGADAEPVSFERLAARRRPSATETDTEDAAEGAGGSRPAPPPRGRAAPAEAERRHQAERQEAERREAERQEVERREAERREAERRARVERQRQAEQRLAEARADADAATTALAERRAAGDAAEHERQSLRQRLAQLQAELRDVEQALSRADQGVLDAAMRRLEAEHAADLARDAVARAEQELAALTASA